MIFYADILVIDDNSDQIALVSSILRKEGFRVCAAISGEAVRVFLEKKIPDLILLNMQMKENADGHEIFRSIKQSERTKDIPVIFMTSEKRKDIINECFELGASDYILKPFSKVEFLARVKIQLRASVQRKEFLAAYEELSQFTSCVSHDLKAPFQLISSMISELNRSLQRNYGEDLPQEITDVTDIINARSKQAHNLIDRLLDFSRMCNVHPVAQPIDTRRITEEVYDDLIILENPERDVDFTCEELPMILADEKLFRMAMRNLLINALKYSSKREHTVIRVYSVPNPLYHVIKVKDNGAGFDMAHADRIFEIFKRLHTEKEFPGTGIGLALVNRVMTKHLGKAEAFGEVDKGAELTLYFPKNVKPIES